MLLSRARLAMRWAFAALSTYENTCEFKLITVAGVHSSNQCDLLRLFNLKSCGNLCKFCADKRRSSCATLQLAKCMGIFNGFQGLCVLGYDLNSVGAIPIYFASRSKYVCVHLRGLCISRTDIWNQTYTQASMLACFIWRNSHPNVKQGQHNRQKKTRI